VLVEVLLLLLLLLLVLVLVLVLVLLPLLRVQLRGGTKPGEAGYDTDQGSVRVTRHL